MKIFQKNTKATLRGIPMAKFGTMWIIDYNPYNKMKIHEFLLAKLCELMNKQMKWRMLFSCQLVSTKGIKELENHHWPPPTRMINKCKISEWKRRWNTRFYLHWIVIYKTLISWSGKKLTLQKPSRTFLANLKQEFWGDEKDRFKKF